MKSLAIALAFTFSTALASPIATKYFVCGTSKVAHIKKDCPALKKCKNKITEYSSLPSGMTVCKFKSGCNGGGSSSQKTTASSTSTKKSSTSTTTKQKTSSSSSTQKKTTNSSTQKKSTSTTSNSQGKKK